MADLGGILETARPWVSTGALMALCEFARRLWVQNRQLKLVENKDDRDGYGALITTLQAAVTSMEAKHAAEIASMRADHTVQMDRIARDHTMQLERIAGEHKRCEERLARIEGELLGFHRQALTRSQHEAVALPASTMVKDAGERALAKVVERMDQIGGTGE